MLVSDILQFLPAALEWMVLFRLDALRPHASDDTIKSMFDIPGDARLDVYSHAILTSDGVRLATAGVQVPPYGDEGGLYNPVSKKFSPPPRRQNGDGPATYAQRFAAQLADFEPDAVDCLGAGELTAFFPPVVMWVRLEGHIGQAQAYFAQEPTRLHYDLLRAVGVEFVAGAQVAGVGSPRPDDTYRAEFRLDLSKHILAGQLSGFSKTGYCNAFFLQQGSIGGTLHAGLTQAAQQRVQRARGQAGEALLELARQAAVEPQPMWCQPPFDKPAFPFGDLVPLGFLLWALREIESPEAGHLVDDLSRYLLGRRSGDLWPFHGGDIPTATDSSLVLLGLDSPAAAEALDGFYDGQGGYYPQLWDAAGLSGRMQVGEWNQHWCQADFATTCLVRAHRRKAGMPEQTPLDYLEQLFDVRSGLFFANPYLVDYALALALGDEADELRRRLAGEVLDSMNADYSFGRFDVALSSALAVACLDALGEAAQEMGWDEETALLARLRLAEVVEAAEAEGTGGAVVRLELPEAAPFYSTFKAAGLPAFLGGQDLYLISLYLDRSRVITTAALLVALGAGESGSRKTRKARITRKVHPRYDCASVEEYINQFAISVYATGNVGAGSSRPPVLEQRQEI